MNPRQLGCTYVLISHNSNLSVSSLLLYLCSCCNMRLFTIFCTLTPPVSDIPSGHLNESDLIFLLKNHTAKWGNHKQQRLIGSVSLLLFHPFSFALHFSYSAECKKLASNWSSTNFLIVHILNFLEVMIKYFWLSWNETCL